MFAQYKVLVLVALAALVFGCLTPGVSAAQSAGLTMKVEPHFGGHFKFGEWLPLRVTLSNDGPSVRAEVRADTIEAGGQTTYVAPVELPAGARKRLTLYVQPPSFAQAVRVRLVEGERELASQQVRVVIERNVHYLVGIVAPRTEPFAVLGGLTLGQATVDGMGQLAAWGYQPRPVSVIHMPLSDIPDRPEGLRILDALVITDVDTSELGPEQAAALQGWVEQGGRLVLGGGAGAQRTLAGLPPALVGNLLSPGVMADLPSLEALGEFSGQAVRVPGPFVVTWPAGGSSLVEQAGQALAVDQRYGQGHVTYVALDLAGSPFDAWAGAARFWERLLSPDSAYPPNWPPDASPRLMQANSLFYALQNLPVLALPSIRWLGVLLIVYVVLVGPVNYLALRWLRKLEWGWLTSLALTALFSLGAFALGHSMRGGDVIVNQISILSFDTRQAAAPVQTYVGIFSPERRSYTLELPAFALASPISMEGDAWGGMGGLSFSGALEIVQGEPAQVSGVQVDQWAMQGLRTESPVPDGWRIESELVHDGERLRGEVINRTGELIVDAVIVEGNRFVSIGELLPGQPTAIDHVWQRSSGSPFPYFLYENMWQMGTESQAELQVRQQVLDSYFGQVSVSAKMQAVTGVPQSPLAMTLVGWLPASPLEVQVSGTRWSTRQTSLLVATLNAHYFQGPVSLPPGSLPARLAEMQGDAGLCGPSASQAYVNNGSLTLEFELPQELAASSVTRLALVIYEGGGSLPAVEVYDRAGEWVELDEPVWGANELPDPARFVSSAGIIRVRLSSTLMGGGCQTYELDVEGVVE